MLRLISLESVANAHLYKLFPLFHLHQFLPRFSTVTSLPSAMGSGESKTSTPGDDQKKIDSDNFTVVQVHLPTFGLVVLTLLLFVLIVASVTCYFRQRRKRSARNLPAPPIPMNNLGSGTPYSALYPSSGPQQGLQQGLQQGYPQAAYASQAPGSQVHFSLDPHILASMLGRRPHHRQLAHGPNPEAAHRPPPLHEDEDEEDSWGNRVHQSPV